jgi:hypothetical protein
MIPRPDARLFVEECGVFRFRGVLRSGCAPVLQRMRKFRTSRARHLNKTRIPQRSARHGIQNGICWQTIGETTPRASRT